MLRRVDTIISMAIFLKCLESQPDRRPMRNRGVEEGARKHSMRTGVVTRMQCHCAAFMLTRVTDYIVLCAAYSALRVAVFLLKRLRPNVEG